MSSVFVKSKKKSDGTNSYYVVMKFKDSAGRWRTKNMWKGTKKADANRAARAVREEAENFRIGLSKPDPTVAEVLADYLKSRQKAGCAKSVDYAVNRIAKDIGALRMSKLTPGRVEEYLGHLKADGYAPSTLVLTRAYLSSAINQAERMGLWDGVNPCTKVKRPKIPPTIIHPLSPAEACALLAAETNPYRHMFFGMMIYTGMRPGELAALQMRDVDLASGFVTVQRSWSRNTTKNGSSRLVPLVGPAEKFVRDGMARAEKLGSQHVFPSRKGTMFARSSLKALTPHLRATMVRAGIIDHWEHKCTHRGCQATRITQDNGFQVCGLHGAEMVATPKPRKFRLYDLRHTAATLYASAGVDARVVTQILGHHSVDFTERVYVHRSRGTIRTEARKLLSVMGEPAKKAG